jgi:hypothetical protein
VVEHSVLVEIVETFCALNKAFMIYKPRDFGPFMDKTLFNTAVGLKNTMFSCLTMRLRAHFLETAEQKQALAFFSLLAHSTLRFAAGFTLNIRIHQMTTKEHLLKFLNGELPVSGSFVDALANLLKAVRPVSAYIRDLGCGRKVDLRLKLTFPEEDPNIFVDEEAMGWEQKKWMDFLCAVAPQDA